MGFAKNHVQVICQKYPEIHHLKFILFAGLLRIGYNSWHNIHRTEVGFLHMPCQKTAIFKYCQNLSPEGFYYTYDAIIF